MGQPILVGHHSERGDRAFRARMNSNFDKSIEAGNKAAAIESSLAHMESDRTIYSDDPEALAKIEAKLKKCMDLAELMVAANKLVRKKDRAGLLALGISEKNADSLLSPDMFGRYGFPSYAMTNNRAEIGRLNQRRIEIGNRLVDRTKEKELVGVRVVDNVEDNRLQLFFPGKPSDFVRDGLKDNGFRWTPSIGAWQSYRNEYKYKVIVPMLLAAYAGEGMELPNAKTNN
jgi:hypothetical protein